MVHVFAYFGGPGKQQWISLGDMTILVGILFASPLVEAIRRSPTVLFHPPIYVLHIAQSRECTFVNELMAIEWYLRYPGEYVRGAG